jgi:hypothetical protein
MATLANLHAGVDFGISNAGHNACYSMIAKTKLESKYMLSNIGKSAGWIPIKF